MHYDLSVIKSKMKESVLFFQKELGGIRTGRASLNLLDPIKVNSYGVYVPLSNVATVNIPEPRVFHVQVWDSGMVDNVAKAIQDSNLGLSPQIDGNVIKIYLPELTQERRLQLVKIVKEYVEKCRICIRNIRKECLDEIKNQKKNSEISEDELHRFSGLIQEVTDTTIKEVDDIFQKKEKEILKI